MGVEVRHYDVGHILCRLIIATNIFLYVPEAAAAINGADMEFLRGFGKQAPNYFFAEFVFDDQICRNQSFNGKDLVG